MNKINVAEKFALFTDYCNPRIVADLNDSHVKLKGEFIWHHHDNEDELFFVMKGTLHMGVRENNSEKEITLRPGEFIVIPSGTEHLPKADPVDKNGECHMRLLEPTTTLNTGKENTERT